MKQTLRTHLKTNVTYTLHVKGFWSGIYTLPYHLDDLPKLFIRKSKDGTTYESGPAFDRYMAVWYGYNHAYLYGLYSGEWMSRLIERLGKKKRARKCFHFQHLYQLLRKGSRSKASKLLQHVYSLRSRRSSQSPRSMWDLFISSISIDTQKDQVLNYLVRTIRGIPRVGPFYFVTIDLSSLEARIGLDQAISTVKSRLTRVSCFGALDDLSSSMSDGLRANHMHIIFRSRHTSLLSRIQKDGATVHVKASYTNQPWPWNVLNAASYVLKGTVLLHNVICTFPPYRP